ncbi:MAG: biotin--[acetyl-CoA-carboxylase] ligase [Eubacteriales bacterium]|nr:biotin--[acetyl-CoA-carboxylase] ligase [Eubacteriales bacterium]
MKIIKLEQITSTNDYSKQLIKSSEISEDFIVISKEQSMGRGSNNKSFYSPKNTGLYFSISILNNNTISIKNININTITPKVSVAIYRSVYNLFNIKLQIKYINDLYLQNKKICGILTETIDYPNSLIIGIGINLYKTAYIPDEIKNTIGFLFDENPPLFDKIETIKQQLIEEITKNIYSILPLEYIPKEYLNENINKYKIPKEIIALIS